MRVRELIERCALAAGAAQVLDGAEIGDELARRLADADGRLGPGPGVALLAGPVLHVSCRPGSDPTVVPLDSLQLLPDAVARAADWALGPTAGAAAFELGFGLDETVPDGLGPASPPRFPRSELEPLPTAGESVLVLAGPGVVRRGGVDDLRALAARADVGVYNTWGAKGLFEWDDPHHLGTIGLQADDFTLAGFAEADVVVATGVDADEAPAERWQIGARVFEVPVEQLAEVARSWTDPVGTTGTGAGMPQLSSVIMPLYEDDRRPRNPARAIIETKQTMGPHDVVAADPGTPAGFWVARAFPTTFLGSVVVPATGGRGFAADAALAGALRRDPVHVVAIGDVLPDTASLARRRGVDLRAEEWADVDWVWTERLVEVAGPIVAWSG